MPKASTFYLGATNRFNKHLFASFQHSSKPWAVGDFTVNMILSSAITLPSRLIGHAAELDDGAEASYRLGSIVHMKDKWWCLLPTDAIHAMAWRPSSYDDPKRVFVEAISDITSDVEAFLKRIGHELPHAEVTKSAQETEPRR